MDKKGQAASTLFLMSLILKIEMRTMHEHFHLSDFRGVIFLNGFVNVEGEKNFFGIYFVWSPVSLQSEQGF